MQRASSVYPQALGPFSQTVAVVECHQIGENSSQYVCFNAQPHDSVCSLLFRRDSRPPPSRRIQPNSRMKVMPGLKSSSTDLRRAKCDCVRVCLTIIWSCVGSCFLMIWSSNVFVDSSSTPSWPQTSSTTGSLDCLPTLVRRNA